MAQNLQWLIMLAFALLGLWRALQPVMAMLQNRPRGW